MSETKKNRVGIRVECAVCHKRKAPHGRSVPLMGRQYCTSESVCAGYQMDPLPGCLWPGETSEQFGFHHCDNATEEIANG